MKTIFLKGINSLGLAIPLIYEIFVGIDAIIYAIAGYAMQTFFAIATLEITNTTLNSFTYITNRVMLLCGIYALFRLSITMINYIVDPNKFDTIGQSGTKVAKNIIIAAVLLASSNLIFSSLFDFQTRVIKTNVIPKIIYGDENYKEEDNGNFELTSKKFVNSVFLQLFQNNTSKDGLSDNAKRALEMVEEGESINIITPYAYDEGFQYVPILTGLVGILLCYYFVRFSIELEVRLIKLFILQVISPIPIIMSVDPSQKGDKIKNFAKLYGGIYLSVFIRILTVYLAFAIISLLNEIYHSAEFESAAGNISWLVAILLIIAVFHAVKEIPKLIEEALGTKLGLGDTGKGFGSLIKGTLAGGAGLVGGAIAGGISGGAGGALAGAFTGLTSGVTKGASAKNAVATLGAGTNAIRGGFATGAKVAGAGGLGMFALGGVENFVGGKGRDSATLKYYDEKIGNKDKEIESVRKGIGSIKENIQTSNDNLNIQNQTENLRKQVDDVFAKKSGLGSRNEFINNNKDFIAARDLLATADPSTSDQDILALRQAMEEARVNAGKQYDSAKNDFYESHFDGTKVDDDLTRAIKDYNDYCVENGISPDRMIKNYDSKLGLTNDAKVSVKSLNEAEINNVQAEISKYQQDIAKEEAEIKRIEQEKKNIQSQKDSFEGSAGYKRRNKRDAKPEYKARNTNNNGAGTP